MDSPLTTESAPLVVQSLDALPLGDRQAINAVWSTFSSSSHPRREIILKGLLTMCCFSQVSLVLLSTRPPLDDP